MCSNQTFTFDVAYIWMLESILLNIFNRQIIEIQVQHGECRLFTHIFTCTSFEVQILSIYTSSKKKTFIYHNQFLGIIYFRCTLNFYYYTIPCTTRKNYENRIFDQFEKRHSTFFQKKLHLELIQLCDFHQRVFPIVYFKIK